MAKQDNLPFPIGTTFFDGQTADTTTNTAITLEGKEYTTEDLDYSKTGAKPYRSARLRKLMIVRNVSGIAILPMRLVTLQITGTDGKFALGRVDGYCTTGPGGNVQAAFPVDEFLPTAGCPNNDLCYVTVEGPATVLTSMATTDFNNASSAISVGDWLVSATAATSQATTAGHVATQGLASGAIATTAATLANLIQHRLGRALSAVTSANTNVALLMYMTKI